MRVYLSFDKILEDTEFQLAGGGEIGLWGANQGLGGAAAPCSIDYHAPVHWGVKLFVFNFKFDNFHFLYQIYFLYFY